MFYTYPMEVVAGDIRLHDDEPTSVLQAFFHALNTVYEERVMRPEYGMPDLLFRGMGLTEVRTILTRVISEGLKDFDVRYSLEFELAEGGVSVTIIYGVNEVKVVVKI
jgi:phage baseplate assembly protein W